MATDRLFGLIGYPLSHSFSKGYFSEKFAKEKITHARYELFPLSDIDQFPQLLAAHPALVGLNVTIPYKEAVLTYLDELEDGAAQVGAVNTIRIEEDRLVGFNTDVYGFSVSLQRVMEEHHISAEGALVLGTGGAAKAVAYVLEQLHIPYQYVSRSAGTDRLTYAALDREVIEQHPVIINTTPLGMSPRVDTLPDIPYHYAGPEHLFYDLVYNPKETLFLTKAKAQGAKTSNGLEMLYLQAEASWSIWNE